MKAHRIRIADPRAPPPPVWYALEKLRRHLEPRWVLIALGFLLLGWLLGYAFGANP